MMFNRGYFGNRGCFGYGIMGGWSSLIMIGFAIVIIIVALILWNKRKNFSDNDDQILYELKLKYVQGEISEEEYLSRKNVLKSK
ncbi:SHOCT domain-containing protein [Clostridium sp. DL1XJH146]